MPATRSKPKASSRKTKVAPASDMFASKIESPIGTDQPGSLWSLVTNHQNALFMFAAGMVMGPSGFGGKHYADTLSANPGWVPLFRSAVPAAALAHVGTEAPHLKPCVLAIDQKAITGRCELLSMDGALREGELPTDLRDNDIAAFVRAPLPSSGVLGISFNSKEDKEAFESASVSVGNVDLSDLPVRVNSAQFDAANDLGWPPARITEEVLDTPPALGQAVGGILAMLYHSANRSEVALEALKTAFRASASNAELLSRDPVLRELPHWLDTRRVSENAEVPARLYWGVVDAIVQARLSGSPLKPIDETLRFLEGQLTTLEDPAYRTRLERLLHDMRRSLGFADSTVTELLERHRGSLSRSLMLFCLRESCEDLLEFQHPMLSDVEFVLAGILFGAREGWLGLPRVLKRPQALAVAVSHRMAEAEQLKSGGGLSFGPPPPRPIPIRELFKHGERGWSTPQQKAALTLARDRKWNECIQTRIGLGKGEYRLIVEAGGVSLLLDGDVKTVSAQVDEAAFMQKIRAERLSEAAENALRSALENKA